MFGVFIAFVATVRPIRRPVAIAPTRHFPRSTPDAGTLGRLVDQCRFSRGVRREALTAPLPYRISPLSLVSADSRGRRKGVLP